MNVKPAIFPGSTNVNQRNLTTIFSQKIFQFPGQQRLDTCQIPSKIPTQNEEECNYEDGHHLFYLWSQVDLTK
jgi:hypothetical protein